MKKISLILSGMAIAAVAILSSCGNNSAVQKSENADESAETTIADPGYVRSGIYELKADELLDFNGTMTCHIHHSATERCTYKDTYRRYQKYMLHFRSL